ncbi:hypothetical protein F383_15345 [Gossypium arboreum]|uniref:Uncharacterized protein n=1 Tax=Gossypium arboreum TaxID=29729 RepID=A0A0B0PTG9_GOSAR|nr:hypothetical protein F383_15345 [Gossypium arboreum]
MITSQCLGSERRRKKIRPAISCVKIYLYKKKIRRPPPLNTDQATM